MITERFSAQLLTGPPARSAAAVTGRLLAVPGQDPRPTRPAVPAAVITATAAEAAATTRAAA
jgi:hypothetical protein